MMLCWLPCVRTYALLRPLPRNVLTLSSPIAVPFALAQTTTVEVTAVPTKQVLHINSNLSLPVTDHLLLQDVVKVIKAAKALDVVVKD